MYFGSFEMFQSLRLLFDPLWFVCNGSVQVLSSAVLPGVQRIHIIVALGYVASPIAEFLTFVMATEWGLRGGESVPVWAQRLLGTQIDPPILSMALFGINALAFAVSAPMWAALCRYIEPRRVMAICLLLQVPLLITIFPVYPRIEMALLLVFLHGMVTSGSFLFLVFNFMMSIKADMSEYAVRLGALEMMRYVVTWLLTGYIFVASPSSKMGTKEQPIPTSISLLLLPVGLIMILLTAIPGGLLFFAPGPYRGDRFPAWNLDLIYQKRSFILLLISDCVGSLLLCFRAPATSPGGFPMVGVAQTSRAWAFSLHLFWLAVPFCGLQLWKMHRSMAFRSSLE